jgi:Na+-exporting ATPase
MLDMLVYGLWMAALCLSAFSLVLYGFGDGAADIGPSCNVSYSEECSVVFRARATTFACLTWFALFLAWEMVNMRRSFFRMQAGSKRYFTQWMFDVWRNKFLFWAIAAGFITMFPLLYIPKLNTVIFQHKGISWEWGIVFVEALLFFLGIEIWKWVKRAYFRRQARKTARVDGDAGRTHFDSVMVGCYSRSHDGVNGDEESGSGRESFAVGGDSSAEKSAS